MRAERYAKARYYEYYAIRILYFYDLLKPEIQLNTLRASHS